MGNDKSDNKEYNFIYNEDNNTIKLHDQDAQIKLRDFRLTIFYKG